MPPAVPILPILELFPFFASISQSFRAELLRSAEGVSLPRGAYYFEEGQYCGNIALLGAGDIRVFKRGENGREITLYHVEQGETCILTASCLLSQSIYPASAVVEKTAQAVVFPAGIFRDWVTRNDEVRKFVFSSMAQRIENVLTLVGEITFRKMDDRLRLFLRERIENAADKRTIQMTHEEIAMELGTAREVVSRLLKELERKGLLEQSRGLIMSQPGKL